MRKKKLAKNTISSLMFQITTVICGFILPRLMLVAFGSEVNGLVSSIVQFLNIIAFLELGVGSVVQSALYKPLADHDNKSISQIIVSAEKFFRKIAQVLLIYVIILIIFYPYLSSDNFDRLYTVTLIGAMCISSFAQYYFGVVDRLLLTADQRGYIQYNAQIITIILNTVMCAILIKVGASIQIVKLISSFVFLARPVFLRIYVNNHYRINRSITYDGEPIKQKWNGVAQHVAAIILDGTDTMVLTCFSTLSNVSIYSVYHLVVYGVKQLFLSMMNGIQALMGELWAKQELEELNNFFGWVEWIVHTGVVFTFTCTGLLIVPFVSIYTNGITDTNYIQYAFGILITVANAVHCLRLPYNIMILAGGHYKQTQHNYIIASVINVAVSIATVHLWGLIGVAIGTLCAMLYQTIWMALYDSKQFIKWPFKSFLKQICVDVLTVVAAIVITMPIHLYTISYFAWGIMAIKIVAIMIGVVVVINMLFYKHMMMALIKKSLRIKQQ